MKKMTFVKHFLVASILIALCFSVSYAQKYNPTRIKVKSGEVYKVQLPSTPSNGYSWDFIDPYDTTFVQYKGHEFVADTKDPKSGKDVFTFKALKKGDARLKFVLKKQYSKIVERVEDYLLEIDK